MSLFYSNAAAAEDVSKPVSETDLPEYPEPEQTTTTSGRTSKKSSQRSIESTDTSSKGKLKGARSQKGISPDPSLLLEEESTRQVQVYITYVDYYVCMYVGLSLPLQLCHQSKCHCCM